MHSALKDKFFMDEGSSTSNNNNVSSSSFQKLIDVGYSGASFQKLIEDAIANDPSWNFVSCVYRTNIVGMPRNITTTWSKNLINTSLQIIVESLNEDEDPPYTCKIDINAWQFWGKKGLKSFEVDGRRVDVFWNLRSAKFSLGPEPCSDYHVALVYDQQMILLLGDQETEAFKRTKSKPCDVKPIVVLKEENIFGKKIFTTRSLLGKEGTEHHIVIEASLYENYEPEMWIGVDGTASIRIGNLHWRFRGHDEFMVDGMSVQVLWDVHDWLYMGSNSGAGIFIFRQSSKGFHPSSLLCNEPNKDDCIEFCHFLHVWKID